MGIKRLSDSVTMRSLDDFTQLLTMYTKKHLDFKTSNLNLMGVTFKLMEFSETTHLQVVYRDYSLHSEWYLSKKQAVIMAYGIYKGLFDSCLV